MQIPQYKSSNLSQCQQAQVHESIHTRAKLLIMQLFYIYLLSGADSILITAKQTTTKDHFICQEKPN